MHVFVKNGDTHIQLYIGTDPFTTISDEIRRVFSLFGVFIDLLF